MKNLRPFIAFTCGHILVCVLIAAFNAYSRGRCRIPFAAGCPYNSGCTYLPRS